MCYRVSHMNWVLEKKFKNYEDAVECQNHLVEGWDYTAKIIK